MGLLLTWGAKPPLEPVANPEQMAETLSRYTSCRFTFGNSVEGGLTNPAFRKACLFETYAAISCALGLVALHDICVL
jgi:hypothetical protein